ncbi:cytochrome P450 [Catenulispora sp. MAP12-49]|uniref:cytochrome P450 n=1 Tax=unclassified Catenulispora TaxID=414885 RepID=UPI0035171D71
MTTQTPPQSTAISRIPMYTPEFAADPHGVYERMRNLHGSLVPVLLDPEVPATLVIGYQTAIRILHDPERFPADPRRWEGANLSQTCPVRPMMEWRPNALRSAGMEHSRYRSSNVYSLNGVDLHALRRVVQDVAGDLIAGLSRAGQADLITQYAFPLAFRVLNRMLGCPPEIGERVAIGMAKIFEGIDAEAGNAMLAAALAELVMMKKERPADDITTRMLQHESELELPEMVHQLACVYGAGIEPQQNLIANTLLLILTDERFSGDVLDGNLTVRDALDEVLYQDPPMANFGISYPPYPVQIDGVWLPADQPVVISFSACNNDPAIASDQRAGNRAHLAWSVGPHACPAQSAAYLIAQAAIDQILDALPEMELAVPEKDLVWRPGPFARGLAALPVAIPVPRQNPVR